MATRPEPVRTRRRLYIPIRCHPNFVAAFGSTLSRTQLRKSSHGYVAFLEQQQPVSTAARRKREKTLPFQYTKLHTGTSRCFSLIPNKNTPSTSKHQAVYELPRLYRSHTAQFTQNILFALDPRLIFRKLCTSDRLHSRGVFWRAYQQQHVHVHRVWL